MSVIETTTPADSPIVREDGKIRRRFSSPFHRSSRSRSRPSSIILPNSFLFDFSNNSTPKDTPPRETPPVLGEPLAAHSSYQAPDEWDVIPEDKLITADATSTTTLDASKLLAPTPERLGVLPSPAKSAYSFLPQDREDDDAPPVPRIPSQKLIDSIVRYSTPPVMGLDKSKTDGDPAGESLIHLECRGANEDIKGNDDEVPADKMDHSASSMGYDSPALAQVSPALSSVGANRLSFDEGNAPAVHVQPDGNSNWILVQERHGSMADVSPMFPPANLALGDSNDEGLQSMGAPAAFRAAYETELIGGDVSPISRHTTTDTEESTCGEMERQRAPPTAMPSLPVTVTFGVEPASPSSPASGAPDHHPGQGCEIDDADALTPRAAEQRRRFTERLSATRLHVVHAEQYVAPSHSQSSFETIDQDSFVTHSQSDGSPLDTKLLDDEAHPVPPLPPLTASSRNDIDHENQPPSVAPPPSQKPEQEVSLPVDNFFHEVPALGNSIASDSNKNRPGQFPPAEPPQKTDKHTESMLSRLSSMVSSGASISPLSSQDPRSRSPSLNRQHAVSPAKITRTPAQIVEEQTPQVNGNIASDDDFDLYADQDGVVKGVQDESGQPLRVTSKSNNMQHQPQDSRTIPPAAQAVVTAPAQEVSTRNSEERPMSFISGPRDSNGRPQDQINRPSTATSDGGESLLQRSPQDKSLSSATYAASPLGQQVPRTDEQPYQNLDQSRGHARVLSSNGPRLDRRLAPQDPMLPPASAFSESPGQFGPPLPRGQHPMPPGPSVPNGDNLATRDARLTQDPRLIVQAQMRQAIAGQPAPPDARFQGRNVQQNPVMPAQHVGTGPNHQVEAYQQIMARQQIIAEQLADPRFLQTQQQTSGSRYTQPIYQPPKKEEKSSSRPKISAVFKTLAKTHGRTPSPPPQQALQPPPPDNRRLSANRTSSHGSGGELPEQAGAKKDRKSGSFSLFPSRPDSIGTASHFSHDSTKAQPADSRFNLTSPDLPANFVGIPPQQPPTGSALGPRTSQDHRFFAQSTPEPGKKKRFSALGNLFGRNKEDKKAIKAKKHSTLPPMQSGQPWPPQQLQQQQQHFHPQNQSVQYAPTPSAPPFPSTQAVPPPLVSPISPQGTPSQAMHQQPAQPLPPGFQQQLSQPYQQKPPQGYHQQHPSHPMHTQVQQQQQLPPQEGSAYVNTQHRAHQDQTIILMSQQAPQNIGGTGIPLNHQPQGVNRTGGTAPAPQGYYISETKLPDHRQGIPQTSAQQNFHPSQPTTQPHSFYNPPNHHQSTAPASSNILPNSQLSKSPPADEPRYETPAIPAAYAPVSGAYVSPNVEVPPPIAQSRDRHSSPGHYNRQNSEPQMHPLPPQVSAITQAPSNRHNSEASSVPLVSPISNSPTGMANYIPVQTQKLQNPRMGNTMEQPYAERPWNLDLPEGATEQEIVRARQRQYMEQQLLAQEQLYAERTRRSPSPRSHTTQSPSPRPPQQQFPHPLSQNGGFRELMPRSSPQPYPRTQALHPRASSDMLDPEKEMLARNAGQTAPTPGRISTPSSRAHSASPVSFTVSNPRNHVPSSHPSPVPTHNSMRVGFQSHQVQSPQSQQHFHQQSPRYEEHVVPDEQYWSQVQNETKHQDTDYQQSPPPDQPPPYEGPALPNDGMEKDRQDRHRPPNIVTNTDDDRGRHMEPRPRQISVGMLQHPQPASMAASPSPSSADMGAEILRRQMLQQEESERQERLRRAQTQHEESIRERQERIRARERARQLERSASGGGRVPSLKNELGSTRSTGTGWVRRRGSTTRPVFELSAAEDEEPVMRATSFPDQVWVPPALTDD